MDSTSSQVIDFKKKKKKNFSEEKTGESSEVKQEELEKSEAAEAIAFPPTFSVSEIKNKQRRHLMFMKLKQEKRKVIKACFFFYKRASTKKTTLVGLLGIMC